MLFLLEHQYNSLLEAPSPYRKPAHATSSEPHIGRRRQIQKFRVEDKVIKLLKDTGDCTWKAKGDEREASRRETEE